MGWPDSADELLAGPRGRRLCWSLVNPRARDLVLDGSCWLRVGRGESAPAAGLATELAAAVARTDLESIAAATAEVALLVPLAESVDAAMYWQPQDAEDVALTAPEVADALMPVARAVSAAQAARWWSGEMAPGRQRFVQYLASDHDDDPPQLSGTAARLAHWRSDTVEANATHGNGPRIPRRTGAGTGGRRRSCRRWCRRRGPSPAWGRRVWRWSRTRSGGQTPTAGR